MHTAAAIAGECTAAAHPYGAAIAATPRRDVRTKSSTLLECRVLHAVHQAESS